ncbi:hypothetical protein CUC08_Gglean011119 [Alternaria sp. MG1]|nr:hypothetical protein CUC08_Gglean011119 [Alternaria sp. MG1]
MTARIPEEVQRWPVGETVERYTGHERTVKSIIYTVNLQDKVNKSEMVALLIEVLDLGHHAQTLAFLLCFTLALDDTSCLTLVDMPPEQAQNFTALPPARHRPIRRLESADRLRPFTLSRLSLTLVLLRQLRLCRCIHALCVGGRHCRATALGCLVGRGCGLLSCPVVNVPVVFVEESVVLLHQ